MSEAILAIAPIVVSILAVIGSAFSFALYYRSNKNAIDSGSLVNQATAGKINTESQTIILDNYRTLIEELRTEMDKVKQEQADLETKHDKMQDELEQVKKELATEREARQALNQRIREFAPQELQDVLIWGD